MAINEAKHYQWEKQKAESKLEGLNLVARIKQLGETPIELFSRQKNRICSLEEYTKYIFTLERSCEWKSSC